MDKDYIMFDIVENGVHREAKRRKSEMLLVMQAIKESHPENNIISTKLCEILPNTTVIFWNKDRNDENPENSGIICKMDKKDEFVRIRKNNHKKIWSYLEMWTAVEK